MSISETSIAKFPAGSGRFMDWLFPAGDARRDNNTGILNIQARNTGDVSTAAMTSGAGTNAFFVTAAGVPCMQMTTANAAGYSLSNDNVLALRMIQQKGHGIPAGYNDIACYRYAWTGAFPDLPAASVDYGFELVFPTNGTVPGIIANAIGGVGWLRRPAGNASLVIQGGGFNEFAITTPGFDPTVFHTYELRFLSATQRAEGLCKALVDGVPFQQFSYGAGTILPAYQAAVRQATCVLQASVTNQIGARLWTYALEVSASATEAGLL